MSDTTAVNKAYFDKAAADYDGKFQDVFAKLEAELKARAHLLGADKRGRLLDYACGTGLISQAIGNYFDQCVGIDLSDNMVEAYNAKAKSQDLFPTRRQAHLGNLLNPADPNPAALSTPLFHDFDAAGVAVAFHHFDDCALAARRLAERLRPNGLLFVVDFLPHGHMDRHDEAVRGVTHHGFDEARMRGLFEQAGVASHFSFDVVPGDVVFGNMGPGGCNVVRRLFFAIGRKA
ncbi:hypothetical protein CDD81_714 [Ophiocordyceps australis]|uniref:Methyltransferase type 11 domain-containing protein n=1 Tax=Ophiocordyceps australis TaxID=1399860 RepID=A0A2C5Y0E6_9HYPO|nr:hypothetical protein CDD81_714 [Ophiocordyceps australis]